MTSGRIRNSLMSNVSEAAIMLFHATFLQRRKEFQVVNAKNPWIQCGPKKVFLGCPMRDVHICNLHDENIYIIVLEGKSSSCRINRLWSSSENKLTHIFREIQHSATLNSRVQDTHSDNQQGWERFTLLWSAKGKMAYNSKFPHVLWENQDQLPFLRPPIKKY